MDERIVADRYRIQRRIASGGMGVIYEAEHVETGRRVALKLMHKGAFFDTDSATWTARMRREARAAGTLDTPHVVQVLDAGEDSTGESYVAMELLRGLDLRQLVKGTGPLPPDVAVRVVAQACLGVAAAHARGVLHRDLKPGNLFLSVDELGGVTVKVIDFGIAKITRDPALTRITVTGQLIGTPTYVSPEQARGLSDVDERTDVWSLGVILYRLLTGAPPHELSGSLTDYLITLCTVPAPPVGERAPWVPHAAATVAMRALEIDRARRHPSVRALFDELSALVPDLRLTQRELVPMPEAARLVSVTPPPHAVASPPPARSLRSLLVGVALLLTLALGIAAGFAFGRRGEPTQRPVASAGPPPDVATRPSVTAPAPSAEPATAAPAARTSSAVPQPTPSASTTGRHARPREEPLPTAPPAPVPSQKPKLEFETGFE